MLADLERYGGCGIRLVLGLEEYQKATKTIPEQAAG